MWEEVYPYLKFEAPQCRGVLQDSENGFLSQFGVEVMGKVWSFNGGFNGEEEEEKSNVGDEKKSFWIFFCWVKRERTCLFILKRLPLSFSWKLCHMSPFEWSKKGPTFSLDVTHTQPQEEKNLTFWNAKILPRFACCFSGSSSSRFSASVGARFRKKTIYIKTLIMKPWAWFRGWFC